MGHVGSYIIYHGLPCSYFYFACFLAEKYYDFYVEMAKMFGFSYGFSRGYPFDDIFWKTFEERLSGNERYVFIGRYVDGLTMDEVAKELHLTKGRICQIQKIIYSKMISFFSTH